MSFSYKGIQCKLSRNCLYSNKRIQEYKQLNEVKPIFHGLLAYISLFECPPVLT